MCIAGIWGIFGIIMGLLSAVLLWSAYQNFSMRWRQRRSIFLAQGEIIDLRVAQYSGYNQKQFHATVQFMTGDGEVITFKPPVRSGYRAAYAVGEQVPVIYDTEGQIEPQIGDHIVRYWAQPLLLLLLALLLFGGALLLFWGMRLFFL